MSDSDSDKVDRELFRNVEKLRQLRIEHRDLDEVIARLSMDIHVILPAALRVRSGGAQGTRDVHIANHSSWETPDLALAVRDHGPGIVPREAARLFEPFRKSARDAAEGGSGVGLRLALSRRLARQMGGDLTSDPPADGGARFVLTLPLAHRALAATGT